MRIFSRLLTIVTATTLLPGCDPTPPGQFSTSLGKIVRSGQATEVDLAAVHPLQWSELYVFHPYSIRDDNCAALKIGWLSCFINLPSDINDHEYFLVFRLDSRIVHTEHHWRLNGDFYPDRVPLPQPIQRRNATFQVEADSTHEPVEKRWYKLRHVPLPTR